MWQRRAGTTEQADPPLPAKASPGPQVATNKEPWGRSTGRVRAIVRRPGVVVRGARDSAAAAARAEFSWRSVPSEGMERQKNCLTESAAFVSLGRADVPGWDMAVVRSRRGRHLRIAVAASVVFLATSVLVGVAPSQAVVSRPDVLRTGGPSEPRDAKVAVLATGANHAKQPFDVINGAGAVVLQGTLVKARIPGPWRFIATADLSAITAPGSYRVRAAGLVSRPWDVRAGASREAIPTLLQFFAANRDGSEPSPLHAAAHLHDAVVASGPSAGQHIDLTGGWMDAGDMLHFTETTAYAAIVLQLAAAVDAPDATALDQEADVGIRWLVKAHPSPSLFIGQVGDERDHNVGFRNPAVDDASSAAGIGTRVAYPSSGSSLSGKAAAALALAADRATGAARSALLSQAIDWYNAGRATAGVGPVMRGGFYRASSWHDDLALAAAMLYRTTGDAAYLNDAVAELQLGAPQYEMGWDDVAGLAGAELCGAIVHAAVTDATAKSVACAELANVVEGARDLATAVGAWSIPTYYSWGQTAVSGGTGSAVVLDHRANPSSSVAIADFARDHLFGRNQWGTSFVVGYGPNAPLHPHHWASTSGAGLPIGAVVGGPANKKEIRSQHFVVKDVFSTARAAYEDRLDDYVTSEPALDYTANSILLLALLDGTP